MGVQLTQSHFPPIACVHLTDCSSSAAEIVLNWLIYHANVLLIHYFTNNVESLKGGYNDAWQPRHEYLKPSEQNAVGL